MKILISPAKSINESCVFDSLNFTQPVFAKEAKKLVAKLKKFKPKQLMDLMHISADIADLNVLRYKNWYLSDEATEEVRPAGFLFTGEVYRGLDFASLSDSEMKRAQEQLRILSGMYGLLKPFDLMYPYRLEMGTKLEVNDKAKNLYAFWGDKLTKSLLKETTKEEVIVNLASNEYAKAILWKSIKQQVITPVFKEFKNGEYKVVMTYAKHARGTMTRFIIREKCEIAEDLKGFNIDGYSYDEKQSTAEEFVFVR